MMMSPVQIRRPDAVEAARALAELTGTTITEAIARALREQLALERRKAEARVAERRAAVEKLLVEMRALPVVGPRLTDDDLYDEHGLPK
jgi:hypothetical protein